MRESNKSRGVFTLTQQSNENSNDYNDAMNKDNLSMQEYMLNTIELASRNNTNNLYYHQSIKVPNAREFQKEIIKEINTHIERNQWELIPIEQAPKGEQVLSSV